MRQIYIDLTTENARVPAGNFIGYLGEHNATELLISIPQVMVDSSDYQILVFQSGPMVFRSGHIDEDKTKSSYRDGNTIHSLVSKSLTRVTGLSVQVECYKEDENGKTILVGKTQTISHLVLKPSPEGFPGYGYDGSYEDIDRVIEYAHKHTNLDVLQKFSVSNDGILLYDGKEIEGGESIIRCDCPALLPAIAANGSIAYVKEDDEPEPSPITTLKRGVHYERLRIKKEITVSDLSIMKNLVVPDETLYYLNYTLSDVAGNQIGSAVFMYIEGVFSVIGVMPTSSELTRKSYYPEDMPSPYYSDIYIYNFTEGLDYKTLSGGEQSLIIPLGWGLVTEYQGNFRLNSPTSYENDMLVKYKTVDYDNDFVFNIIENAMFSSTDSFTDISLEPQLLSILYEVAPKIAAQKGIYIRSDDEWRRLDSLFETKMLFQNSYPELPMNAASGTMANVINNSTQVDLENSCYVNLNNVSRNLYFNPYPMDECKLLDFTVDCKFVQKNGSNITKMQTGFSLATDIKEEYFMLTISKSATENEDMNYIFSYKKQYVKIDADILISVEKGWNRILVNSDGTKFDVVPITQYSEVPYLETPSGYPSYYGFMFTEFTLPDYPSATSFSTSIFSSNKYCECDNAKGLWIKHDGDWEKIESTDEFIRKDNN